MNPTLRDVILAVLAILFIVVCAKRGYANGFMREIRKLAGIAVALICLVLILALKSSMAGHEYGTAIVIAGGIVILGIGWKFVRLVLGLLSGLSDLPVIESLDALLGGAAGIAESIAIIWIIYQIFNTIKA